MPSTGESAATAHGAIGLVLLQHLHVIMPARQFGNLRARVSAQA